MYGVIIVGYPNADYYYYKMAYILLESGNSGEISPSEQRVDGARTRETERDLREGDKVSIQEPGTTESLKEIQELGESPR